MAFAVHNENKTDMDKPFLFVSYSSADKEIVLEDVEELRKLGVNIWVDTQMRVGKDWQMEAFSAMEEVDCKAIIFYVSENSLTSENVLDELNHTRSKAVGITHPMRPLPILPIQLLSFGEGNNITSWYNSYILNKYKKDKMKLNNVYEIKENFLAGGKIIIHNGVGEHSQEYYMSLLRAVAEFNVINIIQESSPVAQERTLQVEEKESKGKKELIKEIVSLKDEVTENSNIETDNGKQGKGIRYNNEYDIEYSYHYISEDIEKTNKPNGWNGADLKGFELFGHKYEISSFSSMLITILSQLYKKDSDAFVKIKESAEKYGLVNLFNGVGSGGIKAPNIIPDTDIQIESKTNYDTKIKQLRLVFEALSISPDEFKILLKLAHRVS